MPDLVTLDSSVIVTAIRVQEEHHEACKALLEKVKDGDFVSVQPYTVLVEVGAAIRRRTGSQSLSERVVEDLRGIDSLFFLELDATRAQRAIELAQMSGLRGMDAVIVQIAEEFSATLVSLDFQMMSSVQGIVETKTPDQLL